MCNNFLAVENTLATHITAHSKEKKESWQLVKKQKSYSMSKYAQKTQDF